MFRAIVATEGLKLQQKKAKTAFPNEEVTKGIFMKQLDGYVDEMYAGYVCKLRKAFYYLEQAPREWFEKINDFLCKDLCFERCPYDPCF